MLIPRRTGIFISHGFLVQQNLWKEYLYLYLYLWYIYGIYTFVCIHMCMHMYIYQYVYMMEIIGMIIGYSLINSSMAG